MLTYSISLWGVLVSSIAYMILGMIWYSPLLFGSAWMKLTGTTHESMKSSRARARKSYIVTFISSIVMFTVLAIFIQNLFAPRLLHIVIIGFLAWLGFVVPTSLSEYLFATRKPWQLFAINSGYHLTALIIGSIILYYF